MTFTDALSAVFDDSARVTRAHWNNRLIYLEMETEGQRRVLTTWDSASNSIDGLLHPWTPSEQDFYSSDWEIIESN